MNKSNLSTFSEETFKQPDTLAKKPIREFYNLEEIEQIKVISEPIRWQMLNLLIDQPLTGAQLARILNIPRQRAHYHLKILEKVGLIEFVSESIRSQMIERYYRAIAKRYLTDQLLTRMKKATETGEDSQLAGEALRTMIQAMLEMVRVDISQPELAVPMLNCNYNFQDDVHLTHEQYTVMRQEMRAMVDRFIEYDRENQASNDPNSLIHMRYTLLFTPALSLDSKIPDTKPG